MSSAEKMPYVEAAKSAQQQNADTSGQQKNKSTNGESPKKSENQKNQKKREREVYFSSEIRLRLQFVNYFMTFTSLYVY